MATNKTVTAILPATLPALLQPLQARVASLANAQGKLTQVAAWRLACAHANTAALLACNVRVLVGTNPKRGAGALAFAAYGGFTGTRITARAYADKVGARAAVQHLLWDTLHGYVALYQGTAPVVLPAWCAPGAKVPTVKAAPKARAAKPKAAAPVQAAPAPAPVTAPATGNGN